MFLFFCCTLEDMHDGSFLSESVCLFVISTLPQLRIAGLAWLLMFLASGLRQAPPFERRRKLPAKPHVLPRFLST